MWFNVLSEQKFLIGIYNSGEPIQRIEQKTPVDQIELMLCFKDLIDSQIRCKYFEDALKTFKKIKLFKLDSMNPDDLEESMTEFAANNDYWEQCKQFNVIGVLCKLKSQAFHGLGKGPLQKWKRQSKFSNFTTKLTQFKKPASKNLNTHIKI